MRPSAIDRIFITHMHADHVLGLPGILPQTVRTTPLHIYGPLGLRAYIRNTLQSVCTNLQIPYYVHEIKVDRANPDKPIRVLNDGRFETQVRLPDLSARADVAAEQRPGSTRPLRPQYGLLDARRRFRHVCEIVLHLDDRSAVEAGWVQRRAGLVTHSSSDNCYDLACRAPALHHAPVAGCPARVVADLPVCASSGACLPALCPASHVASPRRPEAPDDCCDIVDASFRMSADAPNTSGRTPCTGLAPRVSPTTCRACLPCLRPRRGRRRPAPPANAAAYDHNRALLAACSPPGQRRVVALIALVTDARIRLPAPIYHDRDTSCRTPADAPDTSGRTPCTFTTGLECRRLSSMRTCSAAGIMAITLLFCEAPALLLRIQASSEPSLLPRRPLLTLAMLASRNRLPVLVDLQATASCLNHSILVPPWTGSPPYDAVSLRNCRPVRPSSPSALTRLPALPEPTLMSPPTVITDGRIHYDQNTSCWTPASEPDTSGRTCGPSWTEQACSQPPFPVQREHQQDSSWAASTGWGQRRADLLLS
ncbi:unnamed protein product (mitochondrion) [Plasmodiophora brassicae]|uniref:Metallo-beta-lactamase domain-containing protein n=1 Tax=Plasmodiophora brassicae TaxID=37360 RepID=A0A3P3YM25_PLABS|nr:unnamed protein product [Plasmodiophora brassicae]